jgi:hypothetical protein
MADGASLLFSDLLGHGTHREKITVDGQKSAPQIKTKGINKTMELMS